MSMSTWSSTATVSLVTPPPTTPPTIIDPTIRPLPPPFPTGDHFNTTTSVPDPVPQSEVVSSLLSKLSIMSIISSARAAGHSISEPMIDTFPTSTQSSTSSSEVPIFVSLMLSEIFKGPGPVIPTAIPTPTHNPGNSAQPPVTPMLDALTRLANSAAIYKILDHPTNLSTATATATATAAPVLAPRNANAAISSDPVDIDIEAFKAHPAENLRKLLDDAVAHPEKVTDIVTFARAHPEIVDAVKGNRESVKMVVEFTEKHPNICDLVIGSVPTESLLVAFTSPPKQKPKGYTGFRVGQIVNTGIFGPFKDLTCLLDSDCTDAEVAQAKREASLATRQHVLIDPFCVLGMMSEENCKAKRQASLAKRQNPWIKPFCDKGILSEEDCHAATIVQANREAALAKRQNPWLKPFCQMGIGMTEEGCDIHGHKKGGLMDGLCFTGLLPIDSGKCPLYPWEEPAKDKKTKRQETSTEEEELVSNDEDKTSLTPPEISRHDYFKNTEAYQNMLRYKEKHGEAGQFSPVIEDPVPNESDKPSLVPRQTIPPEYENSKEAEQYTARTRTIYGIADEHDKKVLEEADRIRAGGSTIPPAIRRRDSSTKSPCLIPIFDCQPHYEDAYEKAFKEEYSGFFPPPR